MPDVTELRVVGDDTTELDGISIARLLPNLSLSIRDKADRDLRRHRRGRGLYRGA